MLVIGEVGAVSLGITGSGFLGVSETKVPGVGRSLEPVGKGVSPLEVIDFGFGFADLGNLRLVRGCLDDCVDALLPLGRTGLRVLDVGDLFLVVRIDRLLRLDAGHSGLGQGRLRDWTFEFDPVDPNSGRGAVAVLPFVTVELPGEGLFTT